MDIPEYKFASVEVGTWFLPTKAEEKATGWDVRAYLPHHSKNIIIKPFEYVKISLGIRAFCPEGWWFSLVPRSSTFAKKNLHALYGTIDENYEGVLQFSAQYIPDLPKIHSEIQYDTTFSGDRVISDFQVSIDSAPLIVNHQDSIAQIIPVKFQDMNVVGISNEEYDNLCKARGGVRASGGFGSTDR